MLPPAVLDLAERQRGVFARFQAVRLTDVAWRVDNALCSPLCAPVTPPIRGTRRIRGGAPVAEQFAMAAALRARPGATVTGPIVLGMLRIDGFAPDAPFEILTRPGRRLTNVPFAHRCDPDPGRPVAKHGEVRVAGPVDALIDSAAFVEQVGPRALRVAWDQLRWRDLAREHRLVQRIAELWDDAPGAQALHEVLELGGGPRLESEGERGLGAILGCFAPEPEPQVWVTPNRRTDWPAGCERTTWGSRPPWRCVRSPSITRPELRTSLAVIGHRNRPGVAFVSRGWGQDP